jgi:UDP-glucose 4-epimerase
LSTKGYILLTGATGYIGSHTWVELLSAGYDVIGIDNFSNSKPTVLERIKKITSKNLSFKEGDLRSKKFLQEVFEEYPVSAVMHFAGLKAVGESTQEPFLYYEHNITGLFNLLNAMKFFDVKNLIFSSSATVYDSKNLIPYSEDMALACSNPYGWTKLFAEQILRDVQKSDASWKVAYLRYFNPIGAHHSGEIGEDPTGIPNNLMPYVCQVAVGLRPQLSVYGGDWPTLDGTCIRDYIHVMDLAKGHLKAIKYLDLNKKSITVNLGTGHGTSVLDLVKTFEVASDVKIPYRIVERRAGDIAECYADVSRARDLLNWFPQYSLFNMCVDAWRWQVKNPNGYQ